MGGGSAQVNPPYQVSVADGLTAALGDAVTVTDGVEVRDRPGAARRGFAHRSGDRRARHAGPLLDDDGTLLSDDRTARRDRRLVGFDDDFAEPVARVGSRRWCRRGAGRDRRARASATGPWTVGDCADDVDAATSEPTASARRSCARPAGRPTCVLPEPTELDADRRRSTPDGGAAFGLVAQPPRRPPTTAIAEAVAAARRGRRRGRRGRADRGAGDRGGRQDHAALPGAQDALVVRGRGGGPPYGRGGQRRHPGAHAVARRGRRGALGRAARARRAGTPSPPRCSATSSRPAGWSPPSRPPTAPRRPGRRARPTASSPTPRARSSATAATRRPGARAGVLVRARARLRAWEYGDARARRRAARSAVT